MRVIVNKAFLVRGQRQEPGTEVDIGDDLARELIYLQKARAAEVVAPPTGPMTTETAGAVVSGRKRSKGA